MPREHYERELTQLREDLLRLGSMVEHALVRAMRSLETWDIEAAAQINSDDARIDAAQHAVEEKVMRLLATQQPVARDLRLAAAAIAIASELERIGDYANSIARRVRRVIT
ncbi:MAG: phosphate transport system regulatory protein PhoU, partial [Chloroflexaceae bacterium]|nr:phosphate transport system regulatory protein PhoU [Chloroflexaceae bacterium]